MNIKDIFQEEIDPNLIALYDGRIVKIDDNFSDTGILYVDITDPTSSDIEEGKKRSYKARALPILRAYYNAWIDPPEIAYKTKFKGNMSFTSSGDFHLKNYCFDMQTQIWFATVSAALNAIGIVNVPPVLVSLDTTPFPTNAVSINISTSAEEVVNKSIKNALSDINSDKDTSGSCEIPTKEQIKEILLKSKSKSKRLLRSSITEDILTNIVNLINDEIGDIIHILLSPFLSYFDTVSKLLTIYTKYVNNATFPITVLSKLSDEENQNAASQILDVGSSINSKIEEFKNFIESGFDPLIEDITSFIDEKIIDIIYPPVSTIFYKVETTISDIITPIKSKFVDLITSTLGSGIEKLVQLLSNVIQPMVSKLPSVVQMVIKYAIDLFLDEILGKVIEKSLKKITDSINEIFESAIDFVTDKVNDIISSVFGTIIKPLFSPIKEALSKYIIPEPDFITELNSLLDEYINGTKELPLIEVIKYIDKKTNEVVNNPDLNEITNYVKELNNFKLSDLNWSDINHVKCILAKFFNLARDLIHSKRALPTSISIDRDISTFAIVNGNIYGSNENKLEDPINNTGKYTYREYNQASIQPILLQRFNKLTKNTNISDYTVNDKPVLEVMKWQTNNYSYVNIEDKLYIIGNGGYILDEKYVNRLTENGVLYEGIVLEQKEFDNNSLEPYIFMNKNTNTKGSDLLLKLENNELIELKSDLKSEDGYDLYQKIDDSEFNPEYRIPNVSSDVLSFKELMLLYFCPNINSSYSEKEIINLCGDELKPESPNFLWNTLSISSSELNNILSKKERWNNNLLTNITEGASWKLIPKFVSGLNNGITYKVYYVQDENKYEIEDGYEFYTLYYGISGKLNFNSNIDCNILIFNSILSQFNLAKYTSSGSYVEIDIYASSSSKPKSLSDFNIGFTKSEKDFNSGKFFSWIDQTKESLIYTNLKIETLTNTSYDDIDNKLIDIFTNITNVIGQDGIMNLWMIINSQINNFLEPLNMLSSSLTNIDEVMSPILELNESLKDITTISDKISSIASKIETISETAEPALEAIAKTAGSIALQSCSMSQSANGTDFTFSSGDKYDLKSTSDVKSQLPYCKNISSDKLLNEGDRVLVLSVGGGKGNLYVLDLIG